MRRFIGIAVVGGMLLAACSKADETNSPLYQNGYEDGFRDGHRATCKKIENFNSRIKEMLETQSIC